MSLRAKNDEGEKTESNDESTEQLTTQSQHHSYVVTQRFGDRMTHTRVFYLTELPPQPSGQELFQAYVSKFKNALTTNRLEWLDEPEEKKVVQKHHTTHMNQKKTLRQKIPQ